MRMMGVDSVEYHEHTVAGRGDDPVAASGEYYSSLGETPMSWGGSGCGLLGLAGEVDIADYRAVFGIGGAHDPRTGRRLVGCLRPGLELVILPHKSVAELGVIGRADDMHEIVDAERDATLEHLDRLVTERGGRRGRARDLWERSGRLTGPELVAPGGHAYRAGDKVITLAPGQKGTWVTSQAARVTAVDPEAQTLTAVTSDGRQLLMGPDEISADGLAHGYAITAHRAQGTTVEVAHVLDDGGGRELAYVAMSRARNASHVYRLTYRIPAKVPELGTPIDGAVLGSTSLRARQKVQMEAPSGACSVSCGRRLRSLPLPYFHRSTGRPRSEGIGP
ncbi:MAG: relaxase domain-containing protein [Acidimicrobiales bacterium]